MKINKYFPFAFLYFFVNSVALPFGLTYTAILAPLFYIWILLRRKTEVVLPFIVVLCPFIIAQLLYSDINRKVYLYSLLNLILVYIFCQAVYTFLATCESVEKIFRKLLVINFILCLVAVILYLGPLFELAWAQQDLTEGVKNFRRLKMFTYEPSYYATLLVPLFCFYLLQYLFRQNSIKGWLLLLMIGAPFILSFSFGVIAALITSGLLAFLAHFRQLVGKRRLFNSMITSGAISALVVSVIYVFFRRNFFALRVVNIVAGRDTSGKGRTSDAFILAHKLLEKRDELWGIGLGQIKIMGTAILRNYYLYSGDFVAAIPNAAAETFAIFGWIGLALRLFVEALLFFHTKVWTNYYRLWLFFFMFLYQFTGSFITNVAEYVIWILAFTNVFHQFDVSYERTPAAKPLLQRALR